MSMNVNTTTAAYANYQNNYKTGAAEKKKEVAQTTENTKSKKNTTESIAEKNLSKAAQKMLEDLRGSRNDMDFMVADFENGEDDALFIECGYKNKRKAVKKAKELMNQAKSSHLYIDEDIRNKRNPFKNNNWVDLYKEETEQEERIGSIVMEEIKLIA